MRPANCLIWRRNTYTQHLWGRGKHDPSRHLSPDRRTRMGRIEISTMLPITLKVRRNRTDKSSWKFCWVNIFIDKNDVKFWLVSSFAIAEFCIWTIAWDTKISLTMRANLRDNGKILGDIAYGVWSAAAFLGICVLKLWEAALPRLWMRTHRRRVFIKLSLVS